MADEISRAASELLAELGGPDTDAPELALDAATPLDALSPDLVALIVGRTQAGATAFGEDHPRTAITRRIVVPSIVLAVLDAAGLATAAATGKSVLAAVAGVLLVLLAYLAFAGVRFVGQDPLRVTAEQRERVAAARTWRSGQPWTDEQRREPWGRLVAAACVAAGRISASGAWTWASTSAHRAQTQLATTLDAVDAVAFRLTSTGTPAPDEVEGSSPDANLVRVVAALRDCADCLDDLVRRASQDDAIRTELPAADGERLNTLAAACANSASVMREPS